MALSATELRPARPGTSLDDSILSGWGARPYDWQFGISVQQELMPRVSVEAGYYRRWWPIFTTADITDNVMTTAATTRGSASIAPTDPRLPNGGGYSVTNIYNITAAACARSGQRPEGGERLRVVLTATGMALTSRCRRVCVTG